MRGPYFSRMLKHGCNAPPSGLSTAAIVFIDMQIQHCQEQMKKLREARAVLGGEIVEAINDAAKPSPPPPIAPPEQSQRNGMFIDPNPLYKRVVDYMRKLGRPTTAAEIGAGIGERPHSVQNVFYSLKCRRMFIRHGQRPNTTYGLKEENGPPEETNTD